MHLSDGGKGVAKRSFVVVLPTDPVTAMILALVRARAQYLPSRAR